MYPICHKFITNRLRIYAARNFSNCVFPKSSLFQCKKSPGQWCSFKPRASNFHTTQKIHSPLLVLFSIGSVASGSYLRYWWLRKTPMEQQKYLKWYKNKRHAIHGSLAVACLVIVVYCSTFIERDPIMNKPRFIIYSKAEEAAKSDMLFKLIVRSRDNLVPLSDPMYTRIANVMKRLARSNPDIFQDTNWNVTIAKRMFGIISCPTILVLSGGNIIVFSDIFKFIKSDDQLTFNLAHEMAHQMLLHPMETSSLDLIRIIIIDLLSFLLFATKPGLKAATTSVFVYALSIIGFCWYKRRKEAEADQIGFELSAKSCIDPREVIVFWELMKRYRDLINQGQSFIASILGKLFDIHPSVEERIEKITSYIPRAMQLRNQADCSELPDEDPRDKLPQYLKELDDKSVHDSIKIEL